MGGTRWRLGQRLREDVALAHSEWRRPSVPRLSDAGRVLARGTRGVRRRGGRLPHAVRRRPGPHRRRRRAHAARGPRRGGVGSAGRVPRHRTRSRAADAGDERHRTSCRRAQRARSRRARAAASAAGTGGRRRSPRTADDDRADHRRRRRARHASGSASGSAYGASPRPRGPSTRRTATTAPSSGTAACTRAAARRDRREPRPAASRRAPRQDLTRHAHIGVGMVVVPA